LFDRDRGRNAGLAETVELFSPLRTVRVHLRDDGSTALRVRIGVSENIQAFGCSGMRRFELRAKVPTEDGLFRQGLATAPSVRSSTTP
jgi:hypothetical protein